MSAPMLAFERLCTALTMEPMYSSAREPTADVESIVVAAVPRLPAQIWRLISVLNRSRKKTLWSMR